MKVFNLSCDSNHRFEGWFSSQQDFDDQMSNGLLECPFCASHNIQKLLCAPRLNLSSNADPQPISNAPSDDVAAIQGKFLDAVRKVVAQSEDVGARFAQEARRIHLGEAEERSIRGQASPEEQRALREEGIAVMALPAFAVPKDKLQ